MPFVLADPMLIAQTAITAAATLAQFKLAEKQAEMQRLAAEASGLIQRHQSEMQWFELMQGVVNKNTEIKFENINIEVDQMAKEYSQKFSDLNAKLAVTESESIGLMADLNADNVRKDKFRVVRDTGLAISDVNRQSRSAIGKYVSNVAASGISLDSDTVLTANMSLMAETDRIVSQLLVESGDHLGILNIEERKAQTEGVRARALGQIESEEIRKRGAENVFQLSQSITGRRTRISSLESEASNLATTADLVKTSGIASANAAIAAGAAQASTTKFAGTIGAFSTLTSGMTNIFQTYLAKQQSRLATQQTIATQPTPGL